MIEVAPDKPKEKKPRKKKVSKLEYFMQWDIYFY
jgi:hypothetical protein